MVAEEINDSFATAFWEVDFDAEAKTFFRNEYGGKMLALLEDAESAKVVVFMQSGAFCDALIVDVVFDGARWA